MALIPQTPPKPLQAVADAHLVSSHCLSAPKVNVVATYVSHLAITGLAVTVHDFSCRVETWATLAAYLVET